MAETALKGWHSKARNMWRSGATEAEIADRFKVSAGAVQYALRIVKVAEKGAGRGTSLGKPNARTRVNSVAHDELDCVAMMEAIQNGARQSRHWLKRFAGDA